MDNPPIANKQVSMVRFHPSKRIRKNTFKLSMEHNTLERIKR